jgi:hypothetical protein
MEQETLIMDVAICDERERNNWRRARYFKDVLSEFCSFLDMYQVKIRHDLNCEDGYAFQIMLGCHRQFDMCGWFRDKMIAEFPELAFGEWSRESIMW